MKERRTVRVKLENVISDFKGKSWKTIEKEVPNIQQLLLRGVRNYNDLVSKQGKPELKISSPSKYVRNIDSVKGIQDFLGTYSKVYKRTPPEKIVKNTELEKVIKASVPSGYYRKLSKDVEKYEELVKKYNELPETQKLYDYSNLPNRFLTTQMKSPIKLLQDKERLEKIVNNPEIVEVGQYRLYKEDLEGLKRANLEYNKKLRADMIEDIEKYYVRDVNFNEFTLDDIILLYKQAAKRQPALRSKPMHKKDLTEAGLEKTLEFLNSQEEIDAYINKSLLTGTGNVFKIKSAKGDIKLDIYTENYIRGLFNTFGKGNITRINKIVSIISEMVKKYGFDILDAEDFEYGDMEDWYKMNQDEYLQETFEKIYNSFLTYYHKMKQDVDFIREKEMSEIKKVLSEEELYG